MARPNLIKTASGGEITLKGVDAETLAKVKAALAVPTPDAPAKAATAAPTEVALPSIAKPSASDAPMVSPAVGMYQDPLTLEWHVVNIRFSHISKLGEVTDDMKVNRDRYEAVEKFKIQVVKSGLVGG